MRHDMTSSSNLTYNITEEERMKYLDHLNGEKWPFIYPVIIYLALLMVIGIVGNSLVFLVYLKRFKPGTTRVFIMTLAVLDFLTCCVSIPGVIVELRFHYTFFFVGLCRLFRVTRMYFVLMSMFTLLIVAVDRYRKVCRPLRSQYTIKSAWYSILAVNIVAILLTILGGVVAGKRTVPTDRKDVFGSNCSYDDAAIGKIITKLYSMTLFLLFFVSVSLLIVLYVFIGRQVWKHRKFNFRPKSKKGASSSSDSKNPTSSFELKEADTTKSKSSESAISNGDNEKETVTSRVTLGMVSPIEDNPQETPVDPESTSNQKAKEEPTKGRNTASNGGQKRTAGRTTFTLFIITVVFILSFLPFLTLVAIWGTTWMFVNSLHGYVFTVYKIFFHSYHINNVVNCYVYGFCNPKFRAELKKFLRKKEI